MVRQSVYKNRRPEHPELTIRRYEQPPKDPSTAPLNGAIDKIDLKKNEVKMMGP